MEGLASQNEASVSEKAPQRNLVRIILDGREVYVPEKVNLIEAAAYAGVEIPHYCYHPHLSIAGNCRMCQVAIKGQPKLNIACNCLVAEGMEVATHHTSKEVADAQAATLEFILINHPLDCTVCDQAGHCKLQDYHYEYNARPSRFLEEKEHKVKAVPLGPTVMLDGERCIMCTRCIRFCDEVTGTRELGMLNRGDRVVIAVNPGFELNNPLSGSVVDLCPVGALTHRKWRFNTRIWFTTQTDSICPGCSTGCNVKVAVRDGEVVQVKARLNNAVNKEWLCDEGRYGFDRFNPRQRLNQAHVSDDGAPSLKESSFEDAITKLSNALGNPSASKRRVDIFISPDLTLEDYVALKEFTTSLAIHLERSSITLNTVIAYKERKLSKVESILISPDYASNIGGAFFVGLTAADPALHYQESISRLQNGDLPDTLLVVGDRGIFLEDLDLLKDGATLREKLKEVHTLGLMVRDSQHPLIKLQQAKNKIVLPTFSILERRGLMMNRKLRLQLNENILFGNKNLKTSPFASSYRAKEWGINPPNTLGSKEECVLAVWRILVELSKVAPFTLRGDSFLSRIQNYQNDRDAILELLQFEPKLAGIKLADIKVAGVELSSHELRPT
jgi:NADH-quinone oxidoreductase subunit G